MDFEMDFVLKYPTIMPVKHVKDAYKGYIFVGGNGYPISVCKDSSGRFTMEVTPKLQPYVSQLEQILETNDYVHIVQLLNAVTQVISKDHEDAPCTINTEHWRRVLQEYQEFRHFHFNVTSSLSPDLQEIRLTYQDDGRRTHDVLISVNCGKKKELFTVTGFDLPEGCEFLPENSLLGLYGKFLTVVQDYQEFFDLMDEIDRRCWVLDPEAPMRSDTYRRIALGDNVSIVVKFDANKLEQMPSVKVLGPRDQTHLLSKKLLTNFNNWNEHGNILEEILKLLDIRDFPPKPEKMRDGELLLMYPDECCLCFSLRLDEKLPEIVCTNQSCNLFFHQPCLYEWLCTLNPEMSYMGVRGQCPGCEKQIQCPILQTNK